MKDEKPDASNCIRSWLCPEGYALITRDGTTGVYHVENEVTFAGEGVSFAREINDYTSTNLNCSNSKLIVLHHSDRVEFLGETQSYFSLDGAFYQLVKLFIDLIPESEGLVKRVRAVEILKKKNGKSSADVIQSAAYSAYSDFGQKYLQ